MNYQKKSNYLFSKLAKSKDVIPTERVGRYKDHSGLEKKIFKDILKKLDLKKNDNLIDIGCGCGPIVDKLIKYSYEKKFTITLCDIPDVIKILKKKYSKFSHIKFLDGEFQKKKFNKKFNKILCYSVIQYSNVPKKFLRKIINILRVDGKALIGDIPNIDKKYRFLKSKFGRVFEQKRNKKNIKVKNFKNYIKSTNQNTLINDIFMQYAFNLSRRNNRNCLILKQPVELPFSYTREDILIEEY